MSHAIWPKLGIRLTVFVHKILKALPRVRLKYYTILKMLSQVAFDKLVLLKPIKSKAFLSKHCTIFDK
jgi:hypothetical protein